MGEREGRKRRNKKYIISKFVSTLGVATSHLFCLHSSAIPDLPVVIPRPPYALQCMYLGPLYSML